MENCPCAVSSQGNGENPAVTGIMTESQTAWSRLPLARRARQASGSDRPELSRNIEKIPCVDGNKIVSGGSQSERGQSLTELTLTLIAILILLAGLIDMTRAFFVYMALRDAAQEGALFGSLDPTNTIGIENRVRTSSDNPVDLNGPDIDVVITYTTANTCASTDGSNGI